MPDLATTADFVPVGGEPQALIRNRGRDASRRDALRPGKDLMGNQVVIAELRSGPIEAAAQAKRRPSGAPKPFPASRQ